MGNCHIYENAIDSCKLQLSREPFEFPTISIKQVRENINDYQVEDFEIHNYRVLCINAVEISHSEYRLTLRLIHF